MKGIVDINVPKFVAADMQLYKGIMQDLFPNVKCPQNEKKVILAKFEERCKKNCLQATPWFSEKVCIDAVYIHTYIYIYIIRSVWFDILILLDIILFS